MEEALSCFSATSKEIHELKMSWIPLVHGGSLEVWDPDQGAFSQLAYSTVRKPRPRRLFDFESWFCLTLLDSGKAILSPRLNFFLSHKNKNKKDRIKRGVGITTS